jgi:hypothetical protein
VEEVVVLRAVALSSLLAAVVVAIRSPQIRHSRLALPSGLLSAQAELVVLLPRQAEALEQIHSSATHRAIAVRFLAPL